MEESQGTRSWTARVRAEGENLLQRTPLALVAVVGVVAGVVGVPAAAGAATGNVPVQVLAINDFHGRIAASNGNDSKLVTGPGPDGVYAAADAQDSDDVVRRVGGAVAMASTVRKLQGEFRRKAGGSAASFFVGVGDLIGNAPPESADYRDEPTIEVLDALGMDVSAAGNNEFDRGTQELRRISAATDGQYTDNVTACQGVTPGKDGCFGADEHAFAGAQFPYLAANVVSRATGEPMLPPYHVLYTPEGLRVAFIGVVLEKTPEHAPPGTLPDVEFLDEANAVNRWVPEIRAQGIEAIGVLVHDGGAPAAASPDPSRCDQFAGPIIDTNSRIDPAVDVVVTGHTHKAYTCQLPVPQGEPRLVTQAGAHGRLVTDIRLTLDRGTGDVDRKATYSAVNVPTVRSDPDPDPDLQAIVNYWVAGPGNQRAGTVTAEPLDASSAVAAAGPRSNARIIGMVAIAGAVVLAVLVWLKFGRSIGRPAPARRQRSVPPR